MNSKEKVLLKLIEELHVFCKEHDILYYLAETEKTAWSATLMMDGANMRKFLDDFKCKREDRALEWAGNNHAIVGDQIKYIDLSTLYYNQARLVREKYLGMYITIKPLGPSGSKLTKLDRFHRHMDFESNENRSAILNAASRKIHTSRIAAVKGKIKAKEITEVSIYGSPVYVRTSSSFAADPEAAWDTLIVRKKNNADFMCDETISYKEIDLGEDRKTLAAYERKLDRPRIIFKRGDALSSKCVQVSNASFCRFCVATDLLQKYSYEEIEKLGATEGEVKDALDAYLERAVKLRSKKQSGYIGERFTEVINKLYPKVDTNDLYAFTPDLYKEGIRLCDYKGDLIGIYGGSNE